MFRLIYFLFFSGKNGIKESKSVLVEEGFYRTGWTKIKIRGIDEESDGMVSARMISSRMRVQGLLMHPSDSESPVHTAVKG